MGIELESSNIINIFRFKITREDALKKVVDHLNERDIVVGTTGMLSRELYELR